MSEARFKDLLSAAGVRAVYGESTPAEQQSSISQRAAKYLAKYPQLASLRVRGGASADGFHYSDDSFSLGQADPDVLAHEAEHGNSLAGESFYKRVLALSRKASSISNSAAVPAVLGILSLMDDPDKRRTILGALAGLNAALAAPNIFEEAKASTRVVMNSPDKLRSLAVLAPALASHLTHDLYGTGVYLGARSLAQLAQEPKK